MDLMYLIFLSSGLFLGWSLGANDVSNIFGAAVGSKMLKFRTVAVIASVFIIIGAVYGGEGTTQTLTKLGEVNALAGSFMVALSAAITVYFMAKSGLTTSTSQAIVGGIIGWNLYAGKTTDIAVLIKIVLSWIACPFLAGLIAIGLYLLLKRIIKKVRVHILRQDQYLRIGLILSGAFCTYALGANNIANVMGVFVDSAPFDEVKLGFLHFNPTQILFFIGAIAISVGIWTYSQKVMATIGNNLMQMSPFVAFIVVLAQAVVLFLFSSSALRDGLHALMLPALPLVPVSSTQAVIGAILGIGLLKGSKGINWNITGRIIGGWFTTPLMTMLICFTSLFFLENVFKQVVFLP
ncbi:MAG: inorganic phosphate transporter [Alphaproteobacteria bacterium]|nr:inorganic phosphate transporter [Alphaproteobacteria bacterium]